MFSMTGYGKGVSSEGGETITVEIKTVNHRYLDLGLKLPKNFLFAEDGVKKLISSEISRGHVDLFLTYEKSAALESEYFVNVEAAKGFLKAAETLKRELKDMQVEEDVTLGYLLKLPDVVSKNLPEEQDDETLMRLTLDATRQALANLKQMRLGEGERLKADIALKLDNIERSLEKIKALAPEVVSAYRSALYERIKGFVEENLDMQRFVTEIALDADPVAAAQGAALLVVIQGNRRRNGDRVGGYHPCGHAALRRPVRTVFLRHGRHRKGKYCRRCQ